MKEKTHRPGGFFSERSEEVELPAAGAKILKIVLCTWKVVKGLNARQNPYPKKRRSLSFFLSLSLSFLFFSLLFSLFLSVSLFFAAVLLFFLLSPFCLLSTVRRRCHLRYRYRIGGFFYFSYFSTVWKVGFFYQMSFFLVETFGIKIDQNTCNSPNFNQIQRCKDPKPKKRKKIKKMADKERTATAAFLPRGLGKEGAKGRHSSAQSQAGCNPENPGFFPSLL